MNKLVSLVAGKLKPEVLLLIGFGCPPPKNNFFLNIKKKIIIYCLIEIIEKI